MQAMRITLAAFGLIAPIMGMPDTGIYAFIDKQGEVHLSNMPDDARYRRVDASADLVDRSARDEAVVDRSNDEAAQRPYSALVAQVAGRFGLEAALLHAVISVESGYNAKALSKHGAGGLMQLMPATARRYGVADVFDPEDNVRGGAQYLNDLLKLFDNDLQLALAAYNAGEGAVMKYGKRIPPYRETAAYVPRVVGYYEKFR